MYLDLKAKIKRELEIYHRILLRIALSPECTKKQIHNRLQSHGYATIFKYVDFLASQELLHVIRTMPNQGGGKRKYYSISELGLAELFASYSQLWSHIDEIALKNTELFKLGFGLWKEYEDMGLKHAVLEILQKANWPLFMAEFAANKEAIEWGKLGNILDRTLLMGLQRDLPLFHRWLPVLKRRPDAAKAVWDMVVSDYTRDTQTEYVNASFLYDVGKFLPEYQSKSYAEYRKFLRKLMVQINYHTMDKLVTSEIRAQHHARIENLDLNSLLQRVRKLSASKLIVTPFRLDAYDENGSLVSFKQLDDANAMSLFCDNPSKLAQLTRVLRDLAPNVQVTLPNEADKH